MGMGNWEWALAAWTTHPTRTPGGSASISQSGSAGLALPVRERDASKTGEFSTELELTQSLLPFHAVCFACSRKNIRVLRETAVKLVPFFALIRTRRTNSTVGGDR
jgi:hypothetical protein